MDRWINSQVRELEPADLSPLPGKGSSPCMPPSGKSQTFLPSLPPRKDMGEAALGGGVVNALLPLRSIILTHPNPQHKSCTIQKSVTYLQPTPDGPALHQPATHS